ncbi:MAG: hypothetical protein WKF68_07405 [Daejeonella sp.]
MKNKVGDKGAEELVSFVKSEVKSEFDSRREFYATKNDIAVVREDMVNMKSDLTKSIYFAGIIQFLAIIASIIAIVNFTIK